MGRRHFLVHLFRPFRLEIPDAPPTGPQGGTPAHNARVIPPILTSHHISKQKKYGAQWALVTGASSGIGKALAAKLCEQVP